MERMIEFNGVKILLTTGQALHEIQNHTDSDPHIVISAYPEEIRIWVRGSVWINGLGDQLR